jgi:thiamine biosynthesis lipoprotein
MGAPFRISVYADDEAAANAAADAAYRRIKELNDVYSDYDPRSETRRLTEKIVPGEPKPVSRDLLHLLRVSRKYSEMTDGGFDVTVGPVVKLWRLAKRKKTKPTAEEIAKATALVGYKQLTIDPAKSTVAFARPGIQLDFGGIAAGYACDEALRIFKEHGLSRVLIEASGDIVCGDPPPGKEGWTIGVGSLTKPDAPPDRYLRVSNCGVTTSGDAFQFIEFDGVRYSHIVDPKTGLGLTTRSSVTVLAKDGTAADALATAATVLGPEKGLKLIESIDGADMLGVYLDSTGTPQEVDSPGVERFVVKEK